MNGTRLCTAPDCMKPLRAKGLCVMHYKRLARNGTLGRQTPEHRFFHAIRFMPSGCVEWAQSRNPDGYGKIGVDGRTVAAHRFSWEMFNGPVPEGLILRHRCDNPPCVNPTHLVLGTFADNTGDMIARGRQRNQKKTHCPSGHPLDGRLPSGWRYCTECNRIRARANYHKTK